MKRSSRDSLAGPDPLDDPLVAAWDAVVRGDQATPAGSDPSDTAVLRRFHTLESIPLPSDAFFGDLERQLARLAAHPVARSSAPAMASDFGSRQATPLTTTSVPWSRQDADGSSAHAARSPHSVPAGAPRRLIWMQAAAAMLAVLLIVGSLVLVFDAGDPIRTAGDSCGGHRAAGNGNPRAAGFRPAPVGFARSDDLESRGVQHVHGRPRHVVLHG